MKCCFNIESISRYVDGSFSLEAAKEVKEHIDGCEKCQKVYCTLLFTGNFLKEEHDCTGSIYENVLDTVDTNRYSVGKGKYRIYAKAHRLKNSLMPLTAAVVICLILMVSFLIRGYIGNVFNVSIVKPSEADTHPFNTLILGSSDNKLTDVIILANYNPTNSQISLLSIPRDTCVSLNGVDNKINVAFAQGGADLAVNTASRLLDVNIKYYIHINTACMEKIIDLLDGVDYNIPFDMNYDDPSQDLYIHLYKGQQTLSGKQVVDFLRFRKPNAKDRSKQSRYDGSDIKRIEAQQEMIKAIIDQKLKLRYITRIDELLRVSIKGMDTNIPLNDSLKLLRDISKVNPANINMSILPGTSQLKAPAYYVKDKDKSDTIVNEYFQSN